jgi:CheY-like chemotaxis protein
MTRTIRLQQPVRFTAHYEVATVENGFLIIYPDIYGLVKKEVRDQVELTLEEHGVDLRGSTASTWSGWWRRAARAASPSRWTRWWHGRIRRGAAAGDPTQAAEAAWTRRKVLIIEDNVDLLEILSSCSARVRRGTARRGEDGVTLATSLRPDVVILDLQLPQMDGIEAGRWIKRELGAVPILVLTAMAGRATGDDPASGCCDAYMAKPAPLDAIRAKVADLLGVRAPGAG